MIKSDNRDTDASKRAKKLCNNKCVICGWPDYSVEELPSTMIIGAHIKDFARDSDADIVSNIIALCPNHHSEFDNNMFYIDTDYIIHSHNMSLTIEGAKLNIKHVEKKYLLAKQQQVLDYWKSKNIPF